MLLGLDIAGGSGAGDPLRWRAPAAETTEYETLSFERICANDCLTKQPGTSVDSFLISIIGI